MPQLPDSGFDRVASFYDRLARLVYGNALEHAQLYLVPHIPDNSRVLIIGGGSGWLLQQVLYTGKQLHILYLDAAPGMLAKARERCLSQLGNNPAKVFFRVGNEDALLPTEQFDVIITPFLLDLFPERRLQLLMQKLHAALAPAGTWLFADFWPVQQPPPWWQRALAWAMYTFFGALSGVKAKKLPDYGQQFNALGMQETASKSFYNDFVQAKVYLRQ